MSPEEIAKKYDKIAIETAIKILEEIKKPKKSLGR